MSELISQLKIHHHFDIGTEEQGVAYQAHSQLDNNRPNKNYSSCSYCKKIGHFWKECRKQKYDNERKRRLNNNTNNQVRGQLQMASNKPAGGFNRPAGPSYNRSSERNSLTGPQNRAAGKEKPDGSNFKQAGAFITIENHYNKVSCEQSSNVEIRKPADVGIGSKFRAPVEATAGLFNTMMHTFTQDRMCWILDTGAYNHMSPHKEFMRDYHQFESPRKIIVGNGDHLLAHGEGSIPFTSGEYCGELSKVLWAPKLTENLFSVGRAIALGCLVEFNEKTASFYRQSQLVLQGVMSPGSIYFQVHIQPSVSCESPNYSFVGASLHDWHRRLGHCSLQTVKDLVRSNAVEGLKITNNAEQECESCINGKLCRTSHPSREHIKASESTAVLDIDTVGPMKVTSLGGSRYFVLATEEYSGYLLAETLSAKSFVADAVKQIINRTEIESGRLVKGLLTDNGTEYTSDI